MSNGFSPDDFVIGCSNSGVTSLKLHGNQLLNGDDAYAAGEQAVLQYCFDRPDAASEHLLELIVKLGDHSELFVKNFLGVRKPLRSFIDRVPEFLEMECTGLLPPEVLFQQPCAATGTGIIQEISRRDV